MKRAFTLIELMVSIALTVIVVFFLYKALETQRKSNTILTKKYAAIEKENLLFKLLYADIYESNESSIEKIFNKDYNILYLSTKNSLHQIPFAHVVYYINPKKKTLVRLESAYPLKLPVDLEKIKYIFADTLVKGVEKFRLFSFSQGKKRELLPGEAPPKEQEKKEKKYLLFLSYKQKNIVFEIFK